MVKEGKYLRPNIRGHQKIPTVSTSHKTGGGVGMVDYITADIQQLIIISVKNVNLIITVKKRDS